ncbi:MAG: Xaa-Pro peptidase family protein, partial [Gemmatimonadota bacterium]
MIFLPAALTAQDSTFDKREYAARRERLLERIKDGVAFVFAAEEHPYNVRFRQAPDFYYLTGIEQAGAVLMMNGVTKTVSVFVLHSPGGGGLHDDTTASARYGVTVRPMENFFLNLGFATGSPDVRALYLPLTAPDDQLHARFESRLFVAGLRDHPLLGRTTAVEQAVDRIRAAEPKLAVVDVSPLLEDLRWVKTPYEITRLRRAGQIGAAAVAEAMRGTRPGMYEYEIAAAAQYVNTRMGARGDAFLPIVPSGPNAPNVHYEANTRRMLAGEVVYLDYGSDYDYYESDITRVWPISGKFSAEQEKMYRCVLEASKAIIASMKPGTTIPMMQATAESVYTRLGYKDAF